MNQKSLHSFPWAKLIIFPLVVFVVVIGLFAVFDIDKQLAHFLSNRPGGFPYAESDSYEFWLHEFPKYIAYCFVAPMLLLTALPWLRRRSAASPRFAQNSLVGGILRNTQQIPDTAFRALNITIAAIILASIVIGALKQSSAVYCPVKIQAFGGGRDIPLASITEPFPSFGEGGNCWPGGHSITGFLFQACFFGFYLIGMRRAAWISLGIAFGAGNFLGLAQVLRGQHYLSHQIWSALICWLVSLWVFWVAEKYHQRAARPAKPEAKKWFSISSTKLSLLLALSFAIFYNAACFSSLLKLIPLTSLHNGFFLLSLSALVVVANLLLLQLVVLPYVGKPLLYVILCCAAAVAYFMSAYGIVIHTNMIQNTFETDVQESLGLVNITLIIYLLLLGVLPSFLLSRTRIVFASFWREAWQKTKVVLISLVAVVALIAPLTADYASFFRNNKEVRQMVNPANFIYATTSYLSAKKGPQKIEPIGEDARISAHGKAQTKPTLFILVVGETARADHFGINGYSKPTTPYLAKEDIINYSQVFSCGTETAVSVPCMFSNLGRKQYSSKKAKAQQGLLDVVARSGYSVLWRDNNSSCKGTCRAAVYEDMAKLKVPELCNNTECFDNILLHQLDEKIAGMNGNKLIVMHQKGSHGPEYFRRYPARMEVFKPVCKVNKLQDCSSEEINNAFDNTILNTDEFLHNTLEWLKQQTAYETALIYVSDHGESLGEKNLYLHGMPYAIAPKEQKHVPFFFWFSPGFEQANNIDRNCLKSHVDEQYSHDNLFHTLLGLLNVETSVYKADLDMVTHCRQH